MNPTPLFSVKYGIGNVITIPNQQLILATTYLSRDIASGATTAVVENSTDFDITNGITIIGNIGQQNSEKVSTSAKTSNTITITGGTLFNHSRGEPVFQTQYHQVDIWSSPTQTGTYSLVASINVQWDSASTIYNHTAGTNGLWYKIRFTNNIVGVNGDFSNPASSTSFSNTSAGYLVSAVRSAVGNTSLPDDFFINAINEARKVANTQIGFGRSNEWRAEFNYPVQLLAGRNYIDLPNTIDFTDTNRSILAMRYNAQLVAGIYQLKYVDKTRWNMLAYQNRLGYTTTNILGDGTVSSVQLNTTGDFGTSGNIFLGLTKPRQTLASIGYTSNNLTVNTLGGITTGITGIYSNVGTATITIASPGVVTLANHGLVAGDIISFTTTGALPTGLLPNTIYYVLSTGLTSSTFQLSLVAGGTAIITTGTQSGVHTLYDAFPAGTQIWAWNISTLPMFFTVADQIINGVQTYRAYFDRPIPSILHGKNLYMDFYKSLVDITYLSDVLPESWRWVYVDYLRFAIKRRRDDSIGEDDEDYIRFVHGLQTIFGNPYTGQSQIIIS